jgi:Cys-rich protein (TIGR01571 family)
MAQNISNKTQDYSSPYACVQDIEYIQPVNSMQYNELQWDSSILGCISCDRPWICFMACLCPCLLFGEIHDGLKQTNPSYAKTSGARCNLAACIYCILDYPLSIGAGLFLTYVLGLSISVIPSMSCCVHAGLRTEIRKKNSQHPISGSGFSDFLFTYCLACCALIQEHEQVFPLHVDD